MIRWIALLCIGLSSSALAQTLVYPGGGPRRTADVLRVTADVSQSTVVFADVTGLTFVVTSGATYSFACFLTYTTAVSTTALELSLNGPATTALDYEVLTATAATTIHNAVQTAYDTVTTPATSGGATRLRVALSGSLIPSAAGTLAVRYRSEVGTSAVTILRGSWCQIHTQ